LFREVRELILRKCASGKEKQVRVIFEKQPFGELERLVTQKLLDLVKKSQETNESDNLAAARWRGSAAEVMKRYESSILDQARCFQRVS